MKRLQLSIAAKLYAIFALLAAITVGLASLVAANAHRHAALMTEFETAFRDGRNVEKINGLIYAILMETRGIYLATDDAEARQSATALVGFNDRLGEVMKAWERNVRPDDADRFRDFSGRVRIFQDIAASSPQWSPKADCPSRANGASSTITAPSIRC